MKRTELINLTLDTKVKLTPKGRVYTVVISGKSDYRPALRDDRSGEIKEVSPFISVYYEVME